MSPLRWLPYTYLLLVAVALIAVALVVGMTRLFPDADDVSVLLAGLVGAPLIWVLIAAAMATRIRPRVRFDARLWGEYLALPARAWSWLWTTLIRVVATHFWRTVIYASLFLVTGTVVGLMLAGGVNGWIVLVVGFIALGVNIGGVRWANGHGSGYTGGVNVWEIVIFFVLIAGVLAWVFVLAVGVFFLALPAMLAWFVLGVLGVPVWLIITAIALAVASYAVPFVLDLRGRRHR